jgi:hypothetical protein
MAIFKLFLGSQEQAAAAGGDAALAATGTATALFVGDFSDANRQPLSVTGTVTVSFAGVGDQTISSPLAATGTGTASFVGADATPAVVATPPALTGGGVGTWSGRKKRKKKDALDELGELIVAVKAQIEPWETAKAYETEQALYRSALKEAAGIDMSNTLAQIEAEIVNLRELVAEQDDEESLLLLV